MTTETMAGVFEYTLPSLGADMDAGRVIEWMVAPGDTVHRGDVMASVETEKSDIDIEIWHDGVVEEFLVDIGVEIAVGTPIARLRSPDDADAAEAPLAREPDGSLDPATPRSEPDAAPGPQPAPDRTPSQGPQPVPVASETGAEPPAALGGVRASPFARRLAAERGIDVTTLDGTGPEGAIVAADVPAEAQPSDPEPAGERAATQRSPESMRRLIAERMARANREIPHYRLVRDIDLLALQQWLTRMNEERPIASRILPAAAYVRAVALAAAKHPELNGFWRDDAFEPGEGVHVAMAVSLRRGGLVTPHVEHADRKSLDETMERLGELVAAARSGTLKSSWMTGSTITLTNLGDTGADVVHGVISPPQVALVGIGRPSDRPWVVDGELTVRPIASVTLAADHRATDGAIGSRFLATLAHALEHPEEL